VTLAITKRKLQLLMVLLAVITMACVPKTKDSAQPMNAIPKDQSTHGLSLEIPDARWEPAFFEALEARTKKAGIPGLRKTMRPDHDLEARFWYDRFEVIEGLIVRRSGGEWSATYLRQMYDHEPSSVQQVGLGVPRSGWDDAWRRLTSAGILTLPDGSTTKCESEVLDGISYVVETMVGRRYRTYRYGNPQFANCDEARRLLSIKTILSEEFRLPPSPR
jgi:hypothetical protein